MLQKDYSGVKCCTGAILVVALLKASMSTSNTSSMPPVACIYGSECKMQHVGTNTDLKCCGKNCNAQFHWLCSDLAEHNLCNHHTCGQVIAALGAFAFHTHHPFTVPAPKLTHRGTPVFPPSKSAVHSVRTFGHGGAAAGKAILTEWQQFLSDNMAYVQAN